MGTLYRCCLVRKVVSKEVAARGRFTFFWTLFQPSLIIFNFFGFEL